MRFISRVFVAIVLCSFSTWAQSAPPVDRLPKDTTFFFAWNGQASVDKARATNSLLRLWDDPEFANARQALMDRAARDSKSAPDAHSKEKMDAFLAVAGNPFIVGMASLPESKAKTVLASSGGGRRAPSGFFLIYDVTGKTEAYQKLVKLWSDTATEKPVLTTTSFSGITITQEESSKSTNFSATTGNYVVQADSREVIEKLITRLSGPAPAESIVSTPAYQAAAAQRVPDAFCEMFVRMPDLSKLEIPPTQGMNFAAMIKAMRFDRMHAFTLSASLAGNGTRMRFAVLGNTAPGSLFDLFAASGNEFRTLALAPAGSSYSANRIDLAALYKTIRTALQAGLSPEQANQFETMETMLGGQIGMNIGDAMQAISGEFATISLDSETKGNTADGSAAFDPTRNLYVLTITRPDDVLKLVQLLGGKNITSETSEGGATILAITLPYTDPTTNAQRKRFHYIGITSNLLIVAPRKAVLREVIARASAPQGPASGGLAADPAFIQARSHFPQNLTSLGYSDLSHMPWQFLIDAMIQEAGKKESEKLTPLETEALRALPMVLSRYLKASYGGMWKDRTGIFMDTYIE